MKIDGISASYLNQQSSGKTSFCAIHPTKYFIKTESGEWFQVSDRTLIRSLQRKIVTWLNKPDIVLSQTPSATAKKPDHIKQLHMRLVRFFLGNDSDYLKNKVVRSVYPENRFTDTIQAYLFTGYSSEIIDKLAKPIGNVKSAINARMAKTRDFYGYPQNDPRVKMSEHEEYELLSSKFNYYDTIKRILNSHDTKSNPKNTIFEAYFIPVKGKKGRDYQLYNAEFKRTMF